MQAVLQIDRQGYKLYFAHNIFEANDIYSDLVYNGKTAIIIPLRNYDDERENESRCGGMADTADLKPAA